MALTREFSETVKGRLERDGEFRLALLKESMESLLEGDLATGKALLRDYINATMGFEALAEIVGTPSKSLHRMLGPNGNPRADNLFRALAALQKAERVDASVEFLTSGASAPVPVVGVHETKATYLARRVDPEGGARSATRWAKRRAAGHRRKLTD